MFKVVLTSGQILRFGGICNQVDYEDDFFVVCKQYINEKEFKTLAIIPKKNIELIINIK